MKIKVLGTGCAKCRKLFAETEKAISSSGVNVDLEKIDKIEEIIKYGVIAMPGLVINGEVKSGGRIPEFTEIAKWINAAVKDAD